MRITDHYGISGPVPFIDVHVERDNRLFLDPSAIRNGSDRRSKRAHDLLVNFFGEVLRLRASSLAADHDLGQKLLSNLHEPNQTRLGMSAKGVTGKAFGPGLANDVWDILGQSPAAREAVLTRLEHLPIFIEGVGPDLISDLATRIVFEVLVDFTREMMQTYPRLGAGATTVESNVYDPAVHAWTPVNFTLPYVAPHQLLLIPKEWTYWRLLMEPGPFYNRYATATVQMEQSTRDERGKLRGPSKKSLKVQFKDQRKLNNGQAVKYKQREDRNLVSEYQQYVDENFEPLADEEIERRTK
jgi:hypothetical protein